MKKKAEILFVISMLLLLVVPAIFHLQKDLKNEFKDSVLLAPIYDSFMAPAKQRKLFILELDTLLANEKKEPLTFCQDLSSILASQISINQFFTIEKKDLLDSDMRGKFEDFQNHCSNGSLTMSPESAELKDWVERQKENIAWLSYWNEMNQYGFLNPAYLRKWEKKIEENAPLALKGRAYMQRASFSLFNDLGPKAIKGEGQWLFYSKDVDYISSPGPLDLRYQEVVRENPLAAILEFKKQLKKEGIDLWFMLVPTKATVYPEKLNPSTLKNFQIPGSNSPSSHFLDSLSNLGIHVINLAPAFQKAKTKGDSLFLWHDTHWTPRGAEIAAQEVALRLKQHYKGLDSLLPFEQYCLKPTQVERTGDLVEMSQLENLKPDYLALPFAKQVVDAHQVFQCESAEDSTTWKPFKNEFKKSKIMVLGDSYSRIYQTDSPRNAGWISHLAAEIKTPISSIVSDGGASTLVREKLARKPKLLKGKQILIWEVVERDIRFGEKGWQDVQW